MSPTSGRVGSPGGRMGTMPLLFQLLPQKNQKINCFFSKNAQDKAQTSKSRKTEKPLNIFQKRKEKLKDKSKKTHAPLVPLFPALRSLVTSWNRGEQGDGRGRGSQSVLFFHVLKIKLKFKLFFVLHIFSRPHFFHFSCFHFFHFSCLAIVPMLIAFFPFLASLDFFFFFNFSCFSFFVFFLKFLRFSFFRVQVRRVGPIFRLRNLEIGHSCENAKMSKILISKVFRFFLFFSICFLHFFCMS